MFSFDHATGVMYTCDAFGAHYATEAPFDTELASLSPHFRFYYDCLMRPNARSVLTALRKTGPSSATTWTSLWAGESCMHLLMCHAWLDMHMPQTLLWVAVHSVTRVPADIVWKRI